MVAWSSSRVAFVIGNAGYAHAKKLKNALNDARALGSCLHELGFLIAGSADGSAGTSSVALDLDRAAMWQRFEAFVEKLTPGDVAFVFYAGHGLQVDDENYLVPTDARLASDNPVGELVPLRQWIEHVARKVGPKGITIIFLDACREQPFTAEQMRRLAEAGQAGASTQPDSQVYHAIKQGFATVRVKAGEQASPTFILFATAPGDFAYDGDSEDHSPFSAALLRHISTRGLSADELFKRVGIDVQHRTETKEVIQDPWRETNLKRDFFFKPRSWQPMFELTGLGLIAGLVTSSLLFQDAVLKTTTAHPWLWAVGLLFGAVAGFGVLRWGSGKLLNAVVATAVSALSFAVAISILQLALHSGMPKWPDVPFTLESIRDLEGLRAFIGKPELLAITFLALLAGMVLAASTTLGLKLELGVFRGFSALTGALVAGLMMALAALAYVMLTTWLAPSPDLANLIMVGLGGLWYAVLGFQLGYCFAYYVPDYRT